jgi:hypothetical protein
MRYQKALHQFDRYRTPTWGEFEFFIEIAEDLFANRAIQVYENGKALRYDRKHYADEFGSLGDARHTADSEKRTAERWTIVVLSAEEFETAWQQAGRAANQPQHYREQRLELPPDFVAKKELYFTRIPPWLRAGLFDDVT